MGASYFLGTPRDLHILSLLPETLWQLIQSIEIRGLVQASLKLHNLESRKTIQ